MGFGTPTSSERHLKARVFVVSIESERAPKSHESRSARQTPQGVQSHRIFANGLKTSELTPRKPRGRAHRAGDLPRSPVEDRHDPEAATTAYAPLFDHSMHVVR
jgi:hypothetical protein